MEWLDAIGQSIEYIEEHIADDITVSDVADYLYMSPFYFQKGFSMLCGYTVSEYIRNRRLALAGGELLTTDARGFAGRQPKDIFAVAPGAQRI